jgi:TonB family protein
MPRVKVADLPVRQILCGVVAVSFLIAACSGGSSSPATQPSPTSPTAPSRPAPEAVYEPGNGVSTPTVVREVRPSYTPQALAAGIQGSVLLAAVVLSDGTVGDVTVLRSLDPGLDTQSVNAAKQWLFNPGMKDGVAVAVRVTIEFTFKIAT